MNQYVKYVLVQNLDIFKSPSKYQVAYPSPF